MEGIGFSNKAIAFRVTIPDLPCANHILLFAQSMEENQLIAMEYASGFPNSIFVVKRKSNALAVLFKSIVDNIAREGD